jgi:hypothetical protein
VDGVYLRHQCCHVGLSRLEFHGPCPGPDWPICLLTLIRSILLLVTNYEGNILQYPKISLFNTKSKTIGLALLLSLCRAVLITH